MGTLEEDPLMFGRWNWMSLYWLAWIVLMFGVPETWALVTHRPNDTLSAQFWRLEQPFGGHVTIVRGIIAVALFGLFFWLWPHIVDHIWR